MKLVNITMRESVNGFTVYGYDGITMLFDEVHEERLEALKALKKYVDGEIWDELTRREQASRGII